ncbi:DUF1272 domain-containing protein [Streptomyces sp. CB03911]|uniref:DUF1272 domain-containing protein n=1 Tax=Streptomyces sp. CB03911 TaxID=1804758 RepID=UPI00093D3138|nr:DUF1272 domain-containing protein [Streptomyces sp. CB03911]
MRGICERCEVSPTSDGAAFICSDECTFCPECTAATAGTCPECGGEPVARPRRTT